MLTPVPRDSPASIGVPRDWVVPREFRGCRGAGQALDMVVVTQPRVRVCDSVAESGNDSQQSTDFSVLEKTIQSLILTRMPYNRFDPQYGINTHKKAPDAV